MNIFLSHRMPNIIGLLSFLPIFVDMMNLASRLTTLLKIKGTPDLTKIDKDKLSPENRGANLKPPFPIREIGRYLLFNNL